MNFKYLYLIFFFATFQMYAQPDSESKSLKIPAVEKKEKDSTPSKLQIKSKSNIGITKKNENTYSGISYKNKVEIREEKEGFSMFDKSKLLDPGKLFEDRINKQAVEQGLKLESMPDQFLGSYKNNGEFVNISCRDHEFPDGDIVQVRVNEDIIIPRLLLTGGYKSFNITLAEGINKIEFIALNQGESGPNTAEFQVYDDKGNLVSSKRWNLLTGVRATIIVTKETEPEKE